MKNGEGTPRFDLTCWYLNVRRVIELVGSDELIRKVGSMSSLAELKGLSKTVVVGLLKDSLTEWLQKANLPTLGKLIASGELRHGAMFTHFDRYYLRGVPKLARARDEGIHPLQPAEAYAKLDALEPHRRLTFRFHSEHFTCNSAWSELTGQRRLLIMGAVTDDSDDIEAIPWVIADPIPDLLGARSAIGRHWQTNLEVHIDSIDNFEKVRDVSHRQSEGALEKLRAIPERDIKLAVAEILGEQTVPSDWGGETSDLFSSWVRMDGERISTAFAFKGPAKFHPMTMADLGKNGDQINRLFSEAADLLVLQHCHEITPAVRATMKAFAQQIANPRLFCLINGYDTLRLLRAYNKCGLSC